MCLKKNNKKTHSMKLNLKPEGNVTVTRHASNTVFHELCLVGASWAPLTSRHLAGVCHFLLTEFQTCFRAWNAPPSHFPSLSLPLFYLLRLIGTSCEPLAMEINLEPRTGKFRLTQIHAHKCTTQRHRRGWRGWGYIWKSLGLRKEKVAAFLLQFHANQCWYL